MIGGDPRPKWPRRFPQWRFVALVLAVTCGVLLVRARIRFASPLERFYLATYIRGELPHLQLRKPLEAFPVVFIGKSVATDPLLRQGTAPASVRILHLEPERFLGWVTANVYDGKTPAEWFRWPLIGFAFCLISFVACGSVLDRANDRVARNGRRLRGPMLVSRWRFNRETRGDGLAFETVERRNPLEWIRGSSALRIPRNRESHHIQIAGDTGAGKSTLIRDILYQVEARGELAIVFDPDREYIQEFLRQERGDWVLNPKDERCPYWPIGLEADDEPTATPIAAGLFPEEPTIQRFFLDHTRGIFAFLLATYKPTVSELAWWMAHPEEIDDRVKGTEHEHTLTANAAPQRAGILGTLNNAGKPLRMMPTGPEGRRTWTVRNWCTERRGWIFITSTPDTLDALRPLQSLWLDMLILKLQSTEKRPDQSRVWMILDELPALNALPQLHTALTKQRKSDNPIVLGFQGMSQLDALYGKKAETILSQAYTNIILRTREPRAAQHMSGLIGKAQIERVRESMPAHWFNHRHHSFSSERLIDPVVMESEIQGLDDLSGYFVQKDKVVRIKFRPRPKRVIAEGLIERVISPAQYRSQKPQPVVAAAAQPSAGPVMKLENAPAVAHAFYTE